MQEPVLAAEAERLGFEYIQVSDLKADICENKITIKSACDSETISQLKSLAEVISDC